MGKDTKQQFLTYFTLGMVAWAWAFGLGLRYLLPTHYFAWYPLIPVVFLILGWCCIHAFAACQARAPRRMFQTYLVMKGAKLLLSLTAWGIYLACGESHKVEFIVVWAIYYLLTLVFESVCFVRFEKSRKGQPHTKGETNVQEN